MKTDTNKYKEKTLTIYCKRHWGGMVEKRLRIGINRFGIFYEWENDGYVTRKPIIKLAEYKV